MKINKTDEELAKDFEKCDEIVDNLMEMDPHSAFATICMAVERIAYDRKITSVELATHVLQSLVRVNNEIPEALEMLKKGYKYAKDERREKN